jgi:predicted AlkP superfamily phosphohydrolase/phosphomutase
MRTLLVGLDGFDHGLFETMRERGELPRLGELAGRGIAGRMSAPPPAATIPSWTSILTGVNPGRHGLFDLMHREGYRLRRAGSEKREAPGIFEMLSSAGRSVVAIGFPGTFPPLEVRGVLLAGPDSPAAVRGRRAGCWPATLHDALVTRFGEDYLSFDPLNQFRSRTTAGPSWYREATGVLVETVGRRIELALYLAGKADGDGPDLLAVHFPEPGAAGRQFWHLHDLNSPRRPEWIDDFVDEATGRVADPVADVYRAVDSACGELVDRFHPGCVVVVSDHGMGGNGTRIASINRRLADEGLLNLERDVGVAAGDVLGLVRRIGLEVVPPDLREGLLGGVGGTVAAEIISRIRLGSIDWARTAAFSEDLGDAPSVHLNEMGREPDGIIHRSERSWWLQHVVDALEEWKAPAAQGEVPPGERSVVERVHLREDLFRGPHLDRIPSLLLELARDGTYGLTLHPGAFRRMREPVEPLPQDLILGSQARSMPGGHRPDGLFLMAPVGDGSGIDAAAAGDPSQESVAPLVLELAGFRVPGHFDAEPGRVTSEKLELLDEQTLVEDFHAAREHAGESRAPRDDGGGDAIRKKLEDLGYL